MVRPQQGNDFKKPIAKIACRSSEKAKHVVIKRIREGEDDDRCNSSSLIECTIAVQFNR